MKKTRNNIQRLQDILGQIDFIESYTNIEEDEFYRNEVLKLAVLKSLEIIGEAASQITKDIRTNYPDMDWDKMITARNYYVHEYFSVDWNWLWQSVKKYIDFGKIKKYCSFIIEQLDKEMNNAP